MPPKTRVTPPAAPSSNITNGDHPPIAPPNPVASIESLLKLVAELSSHKDFKASQKYFSDVAQLQNEVKEKEKVIDAHMVTVSTVSQRQSSLEEELKKKIEIIDKQKKQEEGLQTQINMLKDASNKQLEIIRKANAKISKIESGRKEKDAQVEKLTSSLSEYTASVDKLTLEVSALEKQNAALTQKGIASEKKSREIESFTGGLVEEDIDSRMNRMESLWERACRLVESYFQEDIPDIDQKSPSAWARLRTPDDVQHSVPLPQTNSAPAKRMRIAIILAILARSVDKHIFHPTYTLGEGNEVRQLLLRQAMDNKRKESFCRGLLLSLYPDEQEQAADPRIKRVVKDVSECIDRLLPADKVSAFQTHLEEFVHSACRDWMLTRRNKELLVPTFRREDSETLEVRVLHFEGEAKKETAPTMAAPGAVDDDVLVIFPRFCTVEMDEFTEVIPATVLKKSQIQAALQERDEVPHSPRVSRAMNTRGKQPKARNMSISVSENRSPDNSPFLGQGEGLKKQASR